MVMDALNTDETSYTKINVNDITILAAVKERCIDFLQLFRDFYIEKIIQNVLRSMRKS